MSAIWYTYNNDEKNVCSITGPFSLKGIISAYAKLLYAEKSFKQYKFSGEKLELYIENHFNTFTEIYNFDNLKEDRVFEIKIFNNLIWGKRI